MLIAIVRRYHGPDMPVHREDGSFSVHVELSAEFGDDYEGDDDGYAWLEAWKARVQPRIARAVFDELRADPRFSAVPASRGKNPEDEIEIAVTFRPGAGSAVRS
jgi:hypothetical protein